jgi:predicted oxidoreductase
MILATKGGIRPPRPYDSSPEYLREECEASLRRLGVEVIDVYQVHRPDLLAHPQDVAEVLSALRDEGKVREVGISNHTVAQSRALQSYLPFPLATNQPEFSPLHLDPLVDGTLDWCMEAGLAPLAWSPLGGGRLAGDPPADDPRAVAVAAVCDRIAAEQGVPRSAVVLAWAMHHPAGIVPIIGTQQPARIRECARATEVEFTREQWYEVLVAARGTALP